jgi:hypothetical protein
MISLVLILANNSIALLYISIFILFIFICYHFINKLIKAFKPQQLFKIQSDALTKICNSSISSFKLPEDIKNKNQDNLTDDDIVKIQTNLQLNLIINKICYFLASKINKIKKQKISFVFYSINIFYTIFLTIIIFSLMNYAVYKINPLSFESPGKVSFIFFLYYSFNTFFTYNINDFGPILALSRILNSTEIFFGILTIVILVLLFYTIIREKHDKEMENAIIKLKEQGSLIEKHIISEYKMTIPEAISKIEKLKSSMISVIYYFTSNIDAD